MGVIRLEDIVSFRKIRQYDRVVFPSDCQRLSIDDTGGSATALEIHWRRFAKFQLPQISFQPVPILNIYSPSFCLESCDSKLPSTELCSSRLIQTNQSLSSIIIMGFKSTNHWAVF